MKVENRSHRLVFAMIDMPHWQEDRARGICFEKLYDALHGYSFCFDPYVLNLLDKAPTLLQERELLKHQEKFDFLVSPSRELTATFHSRWPVEKPALWVDPPPEIAASLCPDSRPLWLSALKERLCFCDEHTAPAFMIDHDLYTHLPTGYWAFEPRSGETAVGRVGERPIWLIRGRAGYASLQNLFRWSCSTFNMENKSAFVTGFVRALHAALGLPARQVPAIRWTPDGLRQDFHAFGVTLALLEFGLREGGHDPAELVTAHAPLLSAARAAVEGNEQSSRAKLKEAFRVLADIRRKHYPFERGWLDIPHAGILASSGGLAELEWPELTRDYLAYMADMAEKVGYRFALEYNAGSWLETSRRHPKTVKRLARLWRAGQIELVNGSWSAPLQQFTNIELAAREFELGQTAMEQVFGRRCETYACQEFSFLPSFPGLLRDFGYKRVVHAVQNRGQTPVGRHHRFLWQGKDGRVIAALGHHEFDLVARGVNFYIEWPSMFIGCLKQGISRLDSASMMDQYPLVLREDMARTERYAPVLGVHRTPADVLPDDPDAALPIESFAFDRYKYEAPINDPICDHWISVFEDILRFAHWIMRVEKLSAAAGLDAGAELRPVWEWILYLESHDNLLVPGGTSGDFYYKCVMEFSGPQFGLQRMNFGRLLAACRPEMEATLNRIEGAALKRLGLSPVPRRVPRKAGLHNPHPQVLEHGGWFPWDGEDFAAEDEAIRLRTWQGRAYWAGRLPAGCTVALKTKPAADLRFSLKPCKRTGGWRLRQGPDAFVVAVSGKAGQPALKIRPADGKGSRFKLRELRHGGDSQFGITRVAWAAVDAAGKELRVTAEFVQLEGSPLVFVHADIKGFNPEGPDKERDALRLQFVTATRLKKAQYFASHFVEDSRKRTQTSSPYVAQAMTAEGTLSLLNRGGIWHVRQKDSLDVVLMVPDEKVSHRDFAIAWNLEHPVTTAIRQLDQPLLVSNTKAAAMQALRVSCEQDNLWISSWRPDGQLRVSETEGRCTDVILSVMPGPSDVNFLGERGARGKKPEPDNAAGNIKFHLSPYESVGINLA